MFIKKYWMPLILSLGLGLWFSVHLYMRFGYLILIIGVPSSICLGLLFWALYFFHYFRTRNKIAPLKWSLYIAYVLMSYLIITTSVSISQQRFYNRPGSQLDAIVCFFLPIYTTGLMVAAYSFGWLFEVLVRARKEEYRREDIQRIKSIYSHLCKYKIIYIILFGLIFVHFSALAAAKFLPEMGFFPLSDIHYAAEVGSIRQVKKFLNKDIDVNAKEKGENGETPLHVAALHGHKDIVEFLIESGAMVDSRDNDGRTPLHPAGWAGETEVATILIRHGADVNAQDNFGDTPLHRAVHKGRKKTVQCLLRHGADVNLSNKGNQPPLFEAVWYGYKDITELLLENGAEANFIDKKGRTPLSVAVSEKYKNIEKLLREHGAKE